MASPTEQATGGRIVVRPSLGLLLKRTFESSDGKLVFVLLVMAITAVVGLFSISVPLAVLALVVLLGVVGFVGWRLRLEATPGQLVVGNVVRSTKLALHEIAGIDVQTVNYQFNGVARPNSTRYRVIITTNRADKKGQPLRVAAIATERKDGAWVQELASRTAQVISSGGR